jgi:hypothetical protein
MQGYLLNFTFKDIGEISFTKYSTSSSNAGIFAKFYLWGYWWNMFYKITTHGYFLPVSFMANFKETTGCEICKKLIRPSRIAMSELLRGSCTRVSNFLPKELFRGRRNKTKVTTISSEFRLFRETEKTRDCVSFCRTKWYLRFRFFIRNKFFFVVHEKFNCRCCPSISV